MVAPNPGPPRIELRAAAHLRWDQAVPPEVAVVGPQPGAGAFGVPGPTRIPTRSRAEVSAGEAGTVARILGPDGLPRPRALWVDGPGTRVELPGAPLSLAPHADGGVWSLQRDGLHHVAADGAVVSSVPASGVRLLGASGGGVWVLGLDGAWRVEAGGDVAGPYDWRDPFGSCAWDGRLCRLERGSPPGVRCLDAAGRSTLREMAAEADPFERLVSVDGEVVLTSLAHTLRRRGAGGAVAELAMAGAGLTAAGEPFLATRDGETLLLHAGGALPRRLSPSRAGLAADSYVLAVDGERVLLWAGDRAAWMAGETVERALEATDASYAAEIFPHAWRADEPYPFAGGRDGAVLLAATGPSGIAILEIVAPVRNP